MKPYFYNFDLSQCNCIVGFSDDDYFGELCDRGNENRSRAKDRLARLEIDPHSEFAQAQNFKYFKVSLEVLGSARIKLTCCESMPCQSGAMGRICYAHSRVEPN